MFQEVERVKQEVAAAARGIQHLDVSGVFLGPVFNINRLLE
jgi:hypothetical protein